MKTTIKEQTRVKESIKLEDLQPGAVIEFDINNSPIGLVISKFNNSKEIVLLCHTFSNNNDDNSWFQLAAGWKKQPIRKILGKLTEIIVEPI